MGASASSSPAGGEEQEVRPSAPAPLPETMRALRLVRYPESLSVDGEELEQAFEVAELPLPKPRAGEVLVRISRSPINPSDTSALKGAYNSKQAEPLPAQCGFEASGLVVASGGGFFANMLVGARVAIASGKGGKMWAEYATCPALHAVKLPDDVSDLEGCGVFVNPLTSLAFLEIAQTERVPAVALTAAASALGKMTIRLFRSNGVTPIAIVRRRDNADAIHAEVSPDVHCIVTADADWRDQLRAKAAELDCRLCFDAVAGDLAGEILSALPPKSSVRVYGSLSGAAVGAVSGKALIFEQKDVRGFWLTPYVMSKNMLQQKFFLDRAVSLLRTDLRTQFRAVYPLELAAHAISDYTRNMSAGKVAISPLIHDVQDVSSGGGGAGEAEEKKEEPVAAAAAQAEEKEEEEVEEEVEKEEKVEKVEEEEDAAAEAGAVEPSQED